MTKVKGLSAKEKSVNVFTQEHLDHIRKNGFKPLICAECQTIDLLLVEQLENAQLISDLHKALKELLSAEWMVTHDWGGDRGATLKKGRQALAKAEV